jgi:hypothetical protein
VHDEQLSRQPFPSRTYIEHSPLHVLTICARTAINQFLRASAALASHALIAVGTTLAVYALSTVGITSTANVPIVFKWDLLLRAFLEWTWHTVLGIAKRIQPFLRIALLMKARPGQVASSGDTVLLALRWVA